MLKLVVSLKAGTRSSPGQVYSNTLQLQIWDLATGKAIHELDVPMPPGKPKGFVGPWENPRLLVSLNGVRIAADVDTIHFSTNAEIREWNRELPDDFSKSFLVFRRQRSHGGHCMGLANHASDDEPANGLGICSLRSLAGRNAPGRVGRSR